MVEVAEKPYVLFTKQEEMYIVMSDGQRYNIDELEHRDETDGSK